MLYVWYEERGVEWCMFDVYRIVIYYGDFEKEFVVVIDGVVVVDVFDCV